MFNPENLKDIAALAEKAGMVMIQDKRGNVRVAPFVPAGWKRMILNTKVAS